MDTPQNYQNENDMQKHKRIKKRLRIIGIILLVLGAGLTITGFVSFFTAMGSYGMPKLFWCAFIGLPMLAFGGMLTALGFKKEFARYVKNETTPIFNELGQEIKPGISAITQTIAGSIQNEKITCKCGQENDIGDKFCSRCGSPLTKTCPKCNCEVNDSDKFCNNCGNKLD